MSDSWDLPEGQTQYDPVAEMRAMGHNPGQHHKVVHHNVLEGHVEIHEDQTPKHTITNHDALASTIGLPHVTQEVIKHAPIDTAQKPSIGCIVHYILPDDRCAGEHRPAIIVKIWPEYNGIQHIQLQVFTDGLNDGERYKSGIHWATSVTYADPSEDKPGTWHWPERV